MALFGDPASPHLLVVAPGSAQAIVVDPSSSKAITLQLPVPMSQVLLFTASSPKDAEVRTRALLYSVGQSTVIFFDLDDIEARGSRNLELLQLGKTVTAPSR